MLGTLKNDFRISASSALTIISVLLSVITMVGVTSSIADSKNSIYTKARLAKSQDLQSLTFRSTSLKVDGKQIKLASKEPIEIRFSSKSISVKAGCNNLSGEFSIVKGELRSQTLFSTKMACSEKLMDQDVWLNQLISSKPRIQIQFLSKSGTTTLPRIVLALNSKLTPWMNSGRTLISMNVYETYGFVDTPLGDDNSEALVKSLCNKLIVESASERDAQFAAETNGLIFRVTSLEGQDFATTLDYRVNRINVEILGGVIVKCTGG